MSQPPLADSTLQEWLPMASPEPGRYPTGSPSWATRPRRRWGYDGSAAGRLLLELPGVRRRRRCGVQAGTGTDDRKNCRNASPICSRTGAPDRITSTIVSDVWVWPLATTDCTWTPAAAIASA